MQIDWPTLALQLLNFAILVWLLQRFLYRPVLRLIDARRAAIQKEQEESIKAALTAKDQLDALERQRTAIAGERTAILSAASAQAEQQAMEHRAQALREAQALLNDARETLAREREQAVQALQESAIDLGAHVARRFLAELPDGLRSQAWLERIEHHLEELPAATREELRAELAAGAALQVVIPTALPEPHANEWRARLRALLGAKIAVEYVVDPEVVAGVELRFPHAHLNFSIQTAAESLLEPRAHADAR